MSVIFFPFTTTPPCLISRCASAWEAASAVSTISLVSRTRWFDRESSFTSISAGVCRSEKMRENPSSAAFASSAEWKSVMICFANSRFTCIGWSLPEAVSLFSCSISAGVLSVNKS